MHVYLFVCVQVQPPTMACTLAVNSAALPEDLLPLFRLFESVFEKAPLDQVSVRQVLINTLSVLVSCAGHRLGPLVVPVFELADLILGVLSSSVLLLPTPLMKMPGQRCPSETPVSSSHDVC